MEDCADFDHFRRNSKDPGVFSSLYLYQSLTRFFNNRRYQSMMSQMKLTSKTNHSNWSLELNV